MKIFWIVALALVSLFASGRIAWAQDTAAIEKCSKEISAFQRGYCTACHDVGGEYESLGDGRRTFSHNCSMPEISNPRTTFQIATGGKKGVGVNRDLDVLEWKDPTQFFNTAPNCVGDLSNTPFPQWWNQPGMPIGAPGGR
ncbi:MAG: hypothetical protein Q7V31_06290 [Parvibaculum sp.]|uniref:hypothetical protein n=1 Tax=Parvibaculum sp. TaxID=2024848 RepID=UPI002725981B|nr:hypothetical protein [Parvibaculum sp.]MDO8838521.1 hypothetical protein [Parvibaculum sp.]